MSFKNDLIFHCQEYTNMIINGRRIQLPYKYGGKNLPSDIRETLLSTGKKGDDLQQWATGHEDEVGVDCSGLVYYALNEASKGKVMEYFSNSYAWGVSASDLTSTDNGTQITRARDMKPGCTMRSDKNGHVLVITGVSGSRIDYAHSNGSLGPHEGYIEIGNPDGDLNDQAQVWHDSEYTDEKAKSLYVHTILLDCLKDVVDDGFDMISITATLTVVSQDVEVRHDPSDPDSVFDTLEMGRTFTATARTLIDGDPFFYAEVIGWVDGKHVQGWVKDYNDNNRWWYVQDKYSCPTSEWTVIDGKDYCFGADGYLFVYCYIKSEVKDFYYWVDDDGVWHNDPKVDTESPVPGYRVVMDYKTENAYQG